jgi:hypothetical protein
MYGDISEDLAPSEATQALMYPLVSLAWMPLE